MMRECIFVGVVISVFYAVILFIDRVFCIFQVDIIYREKSSVFRLYRLLMDGLFYYGILTIICSIYIRHYCILSFFLMIFLFDYLNSIFLSNN